MKWWSQDNTNLLILLFLLVVLSVLYRRYETKLSRENIQDTYEEIQQYLLNDVTLGKSRKPILWIHVPYETNSRNWLDFGSRNSFDLNQPYLYLTVKSIIAHCEESFTICIFDDNAFRKLLPDWKINMSLLSAPISTNVRTLGIMQLLYKYGGCVCPISFLCMRDLLPMYTTATRGNKMFVCETIDRNATSVHSNFCPSVSFCGAPKECETVRELCHYLQTIISHDATAESLFLGEVNQWIAKRIQSRQIYQVDGSHIGTKTADGRQIVLDDLMSNQYLSLYEGTYGILIPANELLSRVQYGWFVRLSPRQAIESNTILGNYLLLSVGENKRNEPVLEPLKTQHPSWVGFWKTPLYPGLYSIKPNFLGDNLQQVQYTGR